MKNWLFDPNPAGLLVFLALLAIGAAVTLSYLQTRPIISVKPDNGSVSILKAVESYTPVEPFADPAPVSVMATEAALEQKKLIGRLAAGIHRVRTMRGDAPFWFCGVAHEGEKAVDLSVKIAWHIATNATKHNINPWGLAGLSSNESGFDLCSLGTYPRNAAYDLKILKRRRLTLSHTREEIEKVISDPRMLAKFRSFDLGPIQTLDIYYRRDRHYQGERGRAKDLLTWEGFGWQVGHLRRLGERHKTKIPWIYWPGYRAQWKAERVRWYAKQLGATNDDLKHL